MAYHKCGCVYAEKRTCWAAACGIARNILAFIGSVWIVLIFYSVFFYND